ncbi:mycothione reductase [Nocardioides sp.]|uniref:mycothione reductase n=1 Tax=Nocardioides sp. TaxID=35761 RepID=UPI0027323288|nr:mycothione reductase [Nocardioides sp.]MDP3890458.1 mycothione reductase [Nocardioides sp.]
MTHYDLVVIGSGSGNSLVTRAMADRRVAIVENGAFGGTCLNVGCIPTKMFVHPADLAAMPEHARALGVDLRLDGVRWRDLRDRVFGRIDPASADGREHRHQRSPHVTLLEGRAHFVGDRRLRVVLTGGSEEEITADQVVLAAGSRPNHPPVPGLESVPFHTSDTILRIDEVPRRLVVLGGGVVAAELAHVFGSFGSEVTIVNRSERMLNAFDTTISERFTALARERWEVRTGVEARRIEQTDGGGVRMELEGSGDCRTVEADLLLVATGRVPNSDLLDAAAGGVETDERGVVVVDEHQRTSADGVWALGDVANTFQLKHLANHEARVVRHNLLHPEDLRSSDHSVVPAGVFTAPQIATVGLTEQDAVARGVRHRVSERRYADLAYGWAMEDTTGFAKVLADPDTGLVLGAHVLGPDAATVIQPLVSAMAFGIPAEQFARGQMWIHPALSELAENALLDA